jgi:hypothetical protein
MTFERYYEKYKPRRLGIQPFALHDFFEWILVVWAYIKAGLFRLTIGGATFPSRICHPLNIPTIALSMH